MSKVQFSNEIKALFPGDSPKMRMYFAIALWHEQEGNEAEANENLEKAIQAEEKGE